jgi:hypothetical protein
LRFSRPGEQCMNRPYLRGTHIPYRISSCSTWLEPRRTHLVWHRQPVFFPREYAHVDTPVDIHIEDIHTQVYNKNIWLYDILQCFDQGLLYHRYLSSVTKTITMQADPDDAVCGKQEGSFCDILQCVEFAFLSYAPFSPHSSSIHTHALTHTHLRDALIDE